MGMTYEPSVFPKHHYAERTARKAQCDRGGVSAGLPEGAQTGDRCLRPGCGGLLVERTVVSQDGSCEEVFCTACSRSRVVRVREPYRPMRMERTVKAERLHQRGEADRVRGTSQEADEEVSLPSAVGDLLDWSLGD